MKYFWKTGKEKLISAEEGKVGHEGTVLKNGACKKFMKIVQFILAVEIAFFLGWAFYSFYLSQPPSEIEEDRLELNLLGALHDDSAFHSESPIGLNHLKSQDESSQLNSVIHSGSFTPGSTTPAEIETSEVLKKSEENNIGKEIEGANAMENAENEDKVADNKKQVEEDFNGIRGFGFKKIMAEEEKEKEDSAAREILQNIMNADLAEAEANAKKIPPMFPMTENSSILKDIDLGQPINELQEKEDESIIPDFIKMLHELDRAEAGDKQVSSEINPSGEVISKQFHFQITFGRETGIGDNSQEFEDSQATSGERPASPMFFHIFFNRSDSGEGTPSFKEDEHIMDPFSSPFFPPTDSSEVQSDLFRSSWRIEKPIEVEEPLGWWINLPESQATRESGSSSEEKSSVGGDSATSVFDNGVESVENSIIDVIFGEPDLQSEVVHESEETKNVGSTEVFESEPENLDEVLTDLVTSLFSSEGHEESDDASELKIPIFGVFGSSDGVHVPEEVTPKELSLESAERVGDEYENLIKALFQFPDDHETIGSTDSDPFPKENMISNEETRIETDNDDWKKEEELFHSQPTWKENDSEPEELNDPFNFRNHEYDEESHFDSAEYNYDD